MAMAFMVLTGAFAWLGLWQFRRLARVPRWNLAVILVLTLVSLGLMTRASNLGRRNSPRGNPRRPGNSHTGRRSGADRGLVRYRYPVDVAYLRNPAFRWPEPFVWRGVSGGSAGSRSDEGRILRFSAPSVALGRVGIRRECRHWYVVLRGYPRPVHTQSCLLLENRAGDARRGERIVLYAFR